MTTIEHTINKDPTTINSDEMNMYSGSISRRRLGQSMAMTIEKFVTISEAIAEYNEDIRHQMFAACEEARTIGSTIERLCAVSYADNFDPNNINDNGRASKLMSNKTSLVRSMRGLLASITKVLLLADSIVVKDLLLRYQTIHTSSDLDSVANFIEFAKSFSQLGLELLELTSDMSDRPTDRKDDRRRSQLSAARGVLERSAAMLLTSAKTCSRHPDSSSAFQNRDTVFCQMRRAIDLIHFVVKDGIMDTAASLVQVPLSLEKASKKQRNCEGNQSLSSYLQKFLDHVEITKMTMVGPQARQMLPDELNFLLERIQDFTDSAYTSHEDREHILLLCDRVRLQVNHLLRVAVGVKRAQQILEQQETPASNEIGPVIDDTVKSIQQLRAQLQETALYQASEMLRLSRDAGELVELLRSAALTTDVERLEEVEELFTEHLEHSQEVCTLLRHISPSDSLNIQAKYTEINLKIYGPQLAIAAQTLCSNPTSQIAKDNFEIFIGMWRSLMDDLHGLVTQIADTCRMQRPENQVYTSLPRPGKHGTTQKQLKPVKLDSEEQAKIAKSGLEMKMITSDLEAETEKWGEEGASEEDNDIVRRAKIMSNMAYNMYQFTRGEGALKTTQDLFTQAEYFAEEANRLYKVVRQFSYMVPTSTEKKSLLEKVDEVPTRVQQLQFKVKNPTVGKAATFTKVDSVIQETKNLMSIISTVVTTCFECASKYKLDFRGLTPRGKNSPFRSDSEETGGGATSGESKGGSGSTSDGSM